MTTVAAKPIPKPLFSCAGACSEDVSHYAEELWWIDERPDLDPPVEAGWYCDSCSCLDDYADDPGIESGGSLASYLSGAMLIQKNDKALVVHLQVVQ